MPVTTIILMTDVNAQLTLQTWMSAAFPTGAFTCSHGLETAVADGRIHDANSCEQWIADIIECGSLWNDAVISHCAYLKVSEFLAIQNSSPSPSVISDGDVASRVQDFSQTTRDARTGKDPDNSIELGTSDSLQQSLSDLNDLALALCSGAERLRETTQLGQAFAKATASWLPEKPTAICALDNTLCLPVVVGVQGALADIPVQQLIPASLQSASSNLVWICTRLVPLGQSQALGVISRLGFCVRNTASRALLSTLDDLGSSSLLADLASIEHEQLHTRICIT